LSGWKPIGGILAMTNGCAMPQLWMTYQEIADEWDISADEVRDHVRDHCWKVKKSRDGLSRAQLPEALMRDLFQRLSVRNMPYSGFAAPPGGQPMLMSSQAQA
jgi:hypothetical protein